MFSPMDLTQVLEHWLYGRPRATQKIYLRHVQAALEWMDLEDIRDIELVDLQDYQSHLFHTLHQASATVNGKMAALRSLLRFAHEQEIIARNPAIALKSPKVHSNLHERILTPEQVQAIIACANEGRDQALLVFLYATGCRVSEACGLLWKECRTLPNGVGVVRLLGKGDKWRSVRVPAVPWSRVLALASDPRLYDEVFGIRSSQARNIMKAAAIKAGHPSASPHWLRHCNASHSIEAGAPLPVVRDSLGHSNISITNIYAHSNPDESSGDYLIF